MMSICNVFWHFSGSDEVPAELAARAVAYIPLNFPMTSFSEFLLKNKTKQKFNFLVCF